MNLEKEPLRGSSELSAAVLRPARASVVLSLAVLPRYRSDCIRIVRDHFGDRLQIFVSSAHLDPSVKTGVPAEWYTRLPILRLGKKAFFQVGAVRRGLGADLVVVDLNPRSVNAVLLLGLRKLLGRPSIVWGHIHPQAGPKSKSAGLRSAMRRLADSTISYTYRDREKALLDLKRQPVFVAPNAMYRSADIVPADLSAGPRNTAIYVGRLEPQKKVDLLIRALPGVRLECPEIRLRIIGDGSERKNLELLASSLRVSDITDFDGWTDDVDALRIAYEGAFCSLSPGFAGLGLTQSLGFGVPMIVARSEPHSPEIELADTGGVIWFTSDDFSSCADKLKKAWERRSTLPDCELSQTVRQNYSAEAMSVGFISAVEETLSNSASGVQEKTRSVIPRPAVKAIRALLNSIAIHGPVEHGRNLRIGLGARVNSTHRLVIGDEVAIGPGTAIQVNGFIGNFVMIGMQVQIVGRNDHAYDEVGTPMLLSTWIGDRLPDDSDLIAIHDDVWIGASSVVLSGITVGEGAIIAAGSVVTKDVRPYTVVAGNPAREVKPRFENDEAVRAHAAFLESKRNAT